MVINGKMTNNTITKLNDMKWNESRCAKQNLFYKYSSHFHLYSVWQKEKMSEKQQKYAHQNAA